jgi:hypothetical protein
MQVLNQIGTEANSAAAPAFPRSKSPKLSCIQPSIGEYPGYSTQLMVAKKVFAERDLLPVEKLE